MKFFPVVDNDVAQAPSLLLFPEKQTNTHTLKMLQKMGFSLESGVICGSFYLYHSTLFSVADSRQ